MATAAKAPARRVPGQPDMWIFVLIEAVTFTAYFAAYMLYRMGDPQTFLAGQATLDQDMGMANTLLLLTSSLCMARAVNAVHGGNIGAAQREIALTALFGLGFIACKIAEWHAKLAAGLTLSTSLFYSFYYFLTAIHVFHVVVGFVVLAVVHARLGQAAPDAPGADLEAVQTGATYWHMVDFLWVFIFALLYVMR